MAQHASALKRHRQSIKRRARNQAIKSEIRTLTKKVLSATKEDATDLFRLLQSKFGKAQRKHVLKKNTVMRHVSKIHKALRAKAS